MQQKELYGEITAFMGRLREDPSRENITNMQGAIDYLLEKLHIVTEKLQKATGRQEIELDDSDRRRLASRARILNAHLLEIVEDTWMPDTLMDWYRRLIADKYDSSGNGGKRIGRPRTPSRRCFRTIWTSPHGSCARHCVFSPDATLRSTSG